MKQKILLASTHGPLRLTNWKGIAVSGWDRIRQLESVGEVGGHVVSRTPDQSSSWEVLVRGALAFARSPLVSGPVDLICPDATLCKFINGDWEPQTLQEVWDEFRQEIARKGIPVRARTLRGLEPELLRCYERLQLRISRIRDAESRRAGHAHGGFSPIAQRPGK
jgi:hypothetical protein